MPTGTYAARLEIDYPTELNRLSTLFRPILAIPILVILALLSSTGGETLVNEAGEELRRTTGGVGAGLFAATALMIVVRQRYPRWWFDFARQLERFGARIGSYLLLLTDRYPSTVEEQAVHLDIDYPDVQTDLNRWLPLVKWLLAIPHYIVLIALFLIGAVGVLAAWFAILATGHYPRAIFDYLVGVGRWALRVQAYAFLLVTDEYPPFSLD